MPHLVVAALFCLLAFAAPANAQLPFQASSPAAAGEEDGAGAGEASAEVDTLIGILEDDAARGRLIETLRSAARGDTEVAPGDDAPATNLASRLAEYTSEVAESTAGVFDVLVIIVRSVGALFTGAAGADMSALLVVVLNVGIVIAAVFGVFFLARLIAWRLNKSFSDTAARVGIARRVGVVLASVMVDGITVLAAWGVGYVIALNVGQSWRMGVNQTLFLNAFLLVELAKVVTRAGLSPTWPNLRLLPLDDTTAAYWYFWLSRLVSLIGYTFLFVAPLFARYVSPEAAEATRILVVFAALVMVILIILQNRDRVRGRFIKWASGGDEMLKSLVVFLAGIWHVVAIVYVVVIFGLWLVEQDRALPFVLGATVQSVIAIAVGVGVLSLVGRLSRRGVPMPAEMRQRLPLLETRLNAFVPNVLRFVRLAVFAGIVIALAQIWQLVDFVGWLSSEIGQRVAGSLVSAAIILLVGGLIYLAMSSWVEYRLNPNVGRVPSTRERTLLSLFRNAATVALAVVITMLALAELGVNIGPLIAGAGVVGLAIGFGAQKLVQDVITGVFIQFENAMNEGDVVQLAGTSGVVEKLTIRSVSLRSLDGTLHLIPFSSVDTVSNFMKYFSYHVAEIGVAYWENIPAVKEAMIEACRRLRETELGEYILDDLEVHGLTTFGASAITVRARIKTVAGHQWAIGRGYNEFLKEVFEERDIEIPFPHLTVYMGRNKDGSTTPFPIEVAENITAISGTAAATQVPPPKTPRRRRGKKPKQDAPNEDDDS